MSTVETEKALNESPIIKSNLDFHSLSTIQKILLKTDGTVTLLLEIWLSEAIKLAKISENITSSTQNGAALKVSSGERTLERKTLLQGRASNKNLVYAESVIILDRLDKDFETKLLTTDETIGKLWINAKLETFREIISMSEEQAGDLATYFNIDPKDTLLSRTYRIFSNKAPIMLITEKFPKTFLQ